MPIRTVYRVECDRCPSRAAVRPTQHGAEVVAQQRGWRLRPDVVCPTCQYAEEE